MRRTLQQTALIMLVFLSLAGAGTLLLDALRPSGGRVEAPAFTADEQQWLRENRLGIEILFGYQAPPNAYTDAEGRYVGLLVDYFREIERILGMDIHMRMFPTWDELMRHSKTGTRFIVVGIADTAERRETLRFTDPFIRIPYTIVTRKTSPVKGMADLDGLRVCTVRNYAINDYLREHHPHIIIEEKVDNLEGLRAVSTGECEAMIVNQVYATHIITEQGLSGLRIVGESGYLNELSAACPKGETMLFRVLSKAVRAIPEERHTELLRRWVFTGGSDNTKTYKVLAAAGAVLLAAGLLFWLVLRSLRATVRIQTETIRQENERLREAQKAVREHEDKLRIALERLTFHVHNSPLAVIEFDAEGRVTGWSPRAERMFGWKAEEVVGLRSEQWRFVHEEDLEIMRVTRGRILEEGHDQVVGENRNYAKSGRVVHCRWYISARRDESGEVASVLALVENVTKAKLAEKALIRARDQAQAANRAKNEFLANMSHEIRTPLNGILGMLQIMETTGLDGEQKVYVDKAIASTRRLTSLLADILDLSHLEAGRLELDPAPFDMREVLESVRELFESTARAKGLTLRTACAQQVPERLVGDRRRLEQVLMNLVGNAVKFTEWGGSVSVGCSLLPHCTRQGLCLLLEIRDTGAGIPDENMHNMLDIFVPGEESYQRNYEGAGLGLPISIRLVRLMGGSLCLESAPEKGTVVCISLRLGVPTT